MVEEVSAEHSMDPEISHHATARLSRFQGPDVIPAAAALKENSNYYCINPWKNNTKQ